MSLSTFHPSETLVQNATGGGMAPPVEWHRQPVLGFLLSSNVLGTQFKREYINIYTDKGHRVSASLVLIKLTKQGGYILIKNH